MSLGCRALISSFNVGARPRREQVSRRVPVEALTVAAEVFAALAVPAWRARWRW